MTDRTLSANPPPLCAFGSPWPEPRLSAEDHCLGCQLEAERLDAAFWSGVTAGRWDTDGYTAADRAEQRRRKEKRT